MNIAAEKKDEMPSIDVGEIRSLTITLNGTDRKMMNKISKEFYDFALTYDNTLNQPIIMPYQEAVFTTRKSPCGNGTATFSRHTLRIYQRVFNISLSDKGTTEVLEYLKDNNVDALVKMNS